MNNEVFDLVYVRLSDQKIYHARKIIHGLYKLRDPMLPNDNFTISKYQLVKSYKFQERISMESVRQRSQPIILGKLA